MRVSPYTQDGSPYDATRSDLIWNSLNTNTNTWKMDQVAVRQFMKLQTSMTFSLFFQVWANVYARNSWFPPPWSSLRAGPTCPTNLSSYSPSFHINIYTSEWEVWGNSIRNFHVSAYNTFWYRSVGPYSDQRPSTFYRTDVLKGIRGVLKYFFCRL